MTLLNIQGQTGVSACSFFGDNGRLELWKQKNGMKRQIPHWEGREYWTAKGRYRQVTGQRYEEHALKILDDGNDPLTSWLVASPDGLIPETPGNQPSTRSESMIPPFPAKHKVVVSGAKEIVREPVQICFPSCSCTRAQQQTTRAATTT